MRSDQFEDRVLLEFPDASKIRSNRVDLKWSSTDLYALLFQRLSQNAGSAEAFARLERAVASDSSSHQKALVDAIAGEYMGAGGKRGRVYTWLPLHLADARGDTSPRTFLTAWRGAAEHLPAPTDRAVDHRGLLEGVRQASEARLAELREDYWWIENAFDPMRGQRVPMERHALEELWTKHGTTKAIRERPDRLAPVQFDGASDVPERALIDALKAIGVIEIRSNGKINLPDIFRVEAGIKRKGGVPPPTRAPR
jgi:hypothetical protein